MGPSEERPGTQMPGGATSRTAPKLERLISSAAALMADRGFSQTSIRDVAQETGFSLGGLYYYFQNKEDLLFLIQEKTFSALLEIQERALALGGDADLRLERLVQNHLAYYSTHFNELKVCTYEMESLQGDRYANIAGLRKRYFHLLAQVIAELRGLPPEAAQADPRIRRQTLFVFGMLNWIFMWYDPARDGPTETIGHDMVAMVLGGLDATRIDAERKGGRCAN